jgi:hypothetical protein
MKRFGAFETRSACDVDHPSCAAVDIHHRQVAMRAVEVPEEQSAHARQRGPASLADFFQRAIGQRGDDGVRPGTESAGMPAVGRHPESVRSDDGVVPDELASLGRVNRESRDGLEVVGAQIHPFAVIDGVLPHVEGESAGQLAQAAAIPVDHEGLGRAR